MSSIIEAASSGSSRTARELVYFYAPEGLEAVNNYLHRMQSAARSFLTRQAKLGNERIEFFAQQDVLGAVAGYKVSAPNRDKGVSKLGDGSETDPVIWIFAASVFAIFGWFMMEMGGRFNDTFFSFACAPLWLCAALCFLAGVPLLSYELWFRWKTGYYSSVIDKVKSSFNFAAFTPNYIYFCFNESDGQTLEFRRHAFKDIHRIVLSDLDGDLTYTAIDVSGNEMFKMSSFLTPEGVDPAEQLETRIQKARDASLA